MTKRRKIPGKRRDSTPDSPRGISGSQTNNRAFAERLVGAQTSQSRSETWASLS